MPSSLGVLRPQSESTNVSTRSSPSEYSAPASSPPSTPGSTANQPPCSLSPYTIELDYTLRDLYEEGNTDGQDIYLIPALSVFRFSLTKGLPPSTKYVYQNPLLAAPPHLLARAYVHNVCHWLGFVAGKMNMLMFDLDDETTGHDVEQPRRDTRAFFAQFPDHQRPTVVDVAGVKDINLPPNGVLVSTVPMDCTAHLPQAVPLDAHYRALSKRDLALSRLPTPPTRVVGSETDIAGVQDAAVRAREVERMLRAVEEKAVPFVVKLPQSQGAQGTFMVRRETDRAETLATLRRELDTMLGQLREDNIHLCPASLVVQDFIPGPTAAVSGFVTRPGRAVVTSITSQAMGDSGLWEGNWIDYAEQEEQKRIFAPAMQKIADWLHGLEYFGPVSADIMTNIENGEHVVVDVNPRVSGSHPLGFLTGHLYKRRGFRFARSTIICRLNLAREEFEKRFDAELLAGRVIIGGWAHEPGLKTSDVKLVVAGEDRNRVDEVRGRIQAFRCT